MKTQILILITTIAAAMFGGALSATAQGKPIYFMKDGKAIYNSTTADIDSILIVPTPKLSVKPSTLSFSAAATESYNVDVNTNQSQWDVTSNQAWCMVIKGTNQFTVTATENTSDEQRTATITVTAGNVISVTIPVTQKEVETVGSYYYSDGTWSSSLDNSKTCIGIIFSFNTESKSGLVVSLDEAERMQWATTTSATGAFDLDNGANNLAKIKGGSNWQSNFPTFAWCAAKGEGWYMPARNELALLLKAASVLNPQLRSIAGGTEIDDSNGYWSSSEYSSNTSWVWLHISGIEMAATKSGYCKTRAIFAF